MNIPINCFTLKSASTACMHLLHACIYSMHVYMKRNPDELDVEASVTSGSNSIIELREPSFY